MNVRRRWLGAILTYGLVAILTACAADEGWRHAMQRGNDALRAGEYTQAEEQFSIARNEAKKIDPKGRRLAESLSQLGEVNRDLGNFAKAESLFQEALSIRESVFGPNHGETASCLADLGVLYRLQGLYTPA